MAPGKGTKQPTTTTPPVDSPPPAPAPAPATNGRKKKKKKSKGKAPSAHLPIADESCDNPDDDLPVLESVLPPGKQLEEPPHAIIRIV